MKIDKIVNKGGEINVNGVKEINNQINIKKYKKSAKDEDILKTIEKLTHGETSTKLQGIINMLSKVSRFDREQMTVDDLLTLLKDTNDHRMSRLNCGIKLGGR